MGEKYIESKGRQPYGGYYKRLEGLLNHYVLPQFGSMSMNLIDSVVIVDWLKDLKSLNKGTLLAADTKNQILTTISHIYQYAKYKGLVDYYNPIENIKTCDPFLLRLLSLDLLS